MIRQANPGNIQSVLDGSVVGDIIECDSGNYVGQVNVRKEITLRSASGLGAIFKGGTMRGYPAIFVTDNARAAIVERVTLNNALGTGVQFNDPGVVGAVVRNSLFERCGGMGCLVQRTIDVGVLNNEFAWCGNDITIDPHTDRPGTGLHSIYYGGGTGPRALRGRVEGNWVHDSQNGGAIQIGGCAEDTLVRRNTVQRIIAPAQYAADVAGIQIYSSYLGIERILIEENIVEDSPGWGYCSRNWEAVARVQGTFRNNAGRRCGSGVEEIIYGTKSWGRFETMYVDVKKNANEVVIGDWKLGSPKPVPASDSPLVGLGSGGQALGAFQPSSVPPPPAMTVSTNLTTGQTLSGSVKWNATTANGTPIGVEFYIDGSLKWTETIAPYDYGGTPDGVLDTKTLLNGPHELRVKADTAQVIVDVVVQNAAPPPQDTLPLTILSQNNTTVTVGWTPPAGAVGYRFRKDGGKWSHTWDGSVSQTKFGKPYTKLEVEALGVLAKGDLP